MPIIRMYSGDVASPSMATFAARCVGMMITARVQPVDAIARQPDNKYREQRIEGHDQTEFRMGVSQVIGIQTKAHSCSLSTTKCIDVTVRIAFVPNDSPMVHEVCHDAAWKFFLIQGDGVHIGAR